MSFYSQIMSFYSQLVFFYRFLSLSLSLALPLALSLSLSLSLVSKLVEAISFSNVASFMHGAGCRDVARFEAS